MQAKSKPKEGVTICGWVDRATYDKLKKRADRDERSTSHLVSKAVRFYLEATK